MPYRILLQDYSVKLTLQILGADTFPYVAQNKRRVLLRVPDEF